MHINKIFPSSNAFSKRSIFSPILFLGAVFLIIWPVSLRAQEADIDLERIRQATVFIMQVRNVGDDLFITCISSGTLVSRGGLILTNAHATLTSQSCPGDTLIVAFSTTPGAVPVPTYRAEVVQANAGIDIALLRIRRQLDGRLVDPASLAFPFVELADSSLIRLDQTITVVGYPDVGNNPIEVQVGTVSGFVSEPSLGERAWIKTSAQIPGTMSGGGAYDQQGRLIGIPTTAPIGGVSIGSTICLAIQDTNRDGIINNIDDCVPVGGFINSLRPSNFARSLLRAASLDLTVDLPQLRASDGFSGSDPAFSRLFFAPSVNEAGMPTSVINSLPAGSNSLYLFFDYQNMTPETVYELRVTTDGIPNPTFSLAPVRWSGGARGLWYIGSSDQPWPNGVYDFTLFADGITAGTARLIIGTAGEPTPTLSDIVFGILDNRGTPLGNGFVLPTGNIASARFIFRNMQNGLPWVAIWYYNGIEITRTEAEWTDGPGGAKTINLEVESGLLPGTYRLELYVEGRLASTSDFVIAGAQQGVFPQVFQNANFVSAASVQEAIAAPPVTTFSNTITNLYAIFDWQQIAPGTLWTLRMLVDNNLFYQQTRPWGMAESGDNFVVRVLTAGTIPDGTYRMELLVNNVPLAVAQAQVGIGQLPLDQFARAEAVQVRGVIRDAETGQGIPGITFVLITEDFSVGDFEWRQDQIYATATTDRDGQFQIDRPLQFNTPYSVLIAANGYLPIGADAFTVTTETSNPLELTIYLTRG